MSAKVPAVVRICSEALAEDKCIVIGLQSTGEARTEEAVTKYVSVPIFFLGKLITEIHNTHAPCQHTGSNS